MKDNNKILKISFIALIISMAIIGVGAFLAIGAFTREPTISIERTLYRVERIPSYNLTFLLEPNEIYETDVIQAAPSQPVYLSLVKLVIVNYTYAVSSGIASGSIRVATYLIHPDGWIKRFGETNIQINSSSASALIQLNINSTTELMARLSKQVMARSDLYTIRIVAIADTNIYISQYVRKDYTSHTIDLNILVGANKVALEGNQTTAIAYEEKTRRTEAAKLAGGITVETGRTIALAITGVGLALFTASMILRIVVGGAKRPDEILENKYSGIIVEIDKPTNLNKSTNIVYISKVDEMVKLSRLLEKPILKECLSRNKCEYYIVDHDITYRLKTDEL